MKKKCIVFLLSICIAFCCVACSKSNNEHKEEKIEFDLTQYEDYGELSCGRIWCSVVEGDWDTPNEEKFAYFDSKGNRISQWYSMEEEVPSDYCNDFAIIKSISTHPDPDRMYVTVLNINGKKIAGLFAVGYGPDVSITDFNSDGISCCYGYEGFGDDKQLCWIDNNGLHRFDVNAEEIVRSSGPDMKVNRLGNYVALYLGGYYNYYTAIFTYDGEFVLDVKEAIGGYEVESINMEDDNFNVSFEGADGEHYNCVIDNNGNIIKKPY